MRTIFFAASLVAALAIGCSNSPDHTSAEQRRENGGAPVGTPPPEEPHDYELEEPGEGPNEHPDAGGGPGDGGGAPSCADRVLESKVPLVVTGDTKGMGNDFGDTKCHTASPTEDVAYAWKVPETGRYSISTLNSAFNAQVHIRTACTTGELACGFPVEGGPAGTSLFVTLTKGEDVIIVVDGGVPTSSETGYRLEITRVASETQCGDNLDDDGDGKTDCADSDCSGKIECIENGTNCFDGKDNDLDGVIDCDDPGCQPKVDATLESKVPVTVSGTTVGMTNDFIVYGLSCTEDPVDPNPDVAYSYTAPEDGFYRFSARHSPDNPFGIALAVRRNECGVTPIMCRPYDVPSDGGLTLTKGQEVIISIDPFAAGPYTLTIYKE